MNEFWKKIVDKFAEHIGVVVWGMIIAGTIWGIQLNYAVLDLQRQSGRLAGVVERCSENLLEMKQVDVKLTTLMDLLVKQVERANARVDEQLRPKP